MRFKKELRRGIALSALRLVSHESLGRCPRLEMNAAPLALWLDREIALLLARSFEVDSDGMGFVIAASGGLERMLRSSQLIAIHILLIGNDTGSRSIPLNERESEFL